jgi:predicted metalloprotease with PDZ domain
MSDTKMNLSKWLHIRLKEEDYNRINNKFSKSTCRKLSEYARRVLLDKVLTVNQRNQSLDDFMTEMIRLRNELNAIGNNFNQAVKKLHTLNRLTEFKTWLILNENNQKILLEKVEEIKLKINQISDKWLQ